MNILNLQKKRLVDQWLGFDHILVHVDSRVKGVQVPDSLLGNFMLTLKLSRLFYGKIELQESGITAQLKFSGEYFDCFLPWDSIWGVSSEKGEEKIWNNFLPPELTRNLKKNDVMEVEPEKVDEDLSPRGVSVPFLKRIK